MSTYVGENKVNYSRKEMYFLFLRRVLSGGVGILYTEALCKSGRYHWFKAPDLS